MLFGAQMDQLEPQTAFWNKKALVTNHNQTETSAFFSKPKRRFGCVSPSDPDSLSKMNDTLNLVIPGSTLLGPMRDKS